MASVLVKHCTLRIVRRGGWSWGAEPRRLADRLLQHLPQLLAEALAPLWPGAEERHITAPVRLGLRLPLAALRALLGDTPPLGETALALESVVPRVEAGLAAALRAALGPDAGVSPPPLAPAPASSAGASGERARPDGDLLRLLADWRARNVLHDRLHAFSPEALALWHAQLFAAPALPAAAAVAGPVLEGAETLLLRLVEDAPDLASPSAVLRLRLLALAEFEAMAAASSRSPALRALLDRVLPPPEAPAVEGARRSAPNAARAEAAPGNVAPPTGAAPVLANLRETGSAALPSIMAGELRVDSALPFLLLGPLARLGWLDTLSAVLAAARLDAAPALFGAALAYKVLPPPARGWFREAPTRATAAALALLPEAPEDAALAALARDLAPLLSPLDATLSGALIEGHAGGAPLLLSAAGSRLLLSEVEGAFPIAIADDVEALLPLLRRAPLLLVAGDACRAGLLSALDAAGQRFVTDALDGRHRAWRGIRRRPGERWWSNDRQAPEAALATAAQHLAPAAERAAECWQEIGLSRPAVPRLGEHPFEDALTLAAAIALGSIAWQLWRSREATAPQLALRRFHDLSACIRIDAATVRVLLPLGRRFFDLSEHRLLADVPGVPWLGGRVLRFDTG